MGSNIICSISFNESGDAQVLLQKTNQIDGDKFVSNWRTTIAKNSSLDEPLHTTWGDISWDDFSAEKAYLLAKWQE